MSEVFDKIISQYKAEDNTKKRDEEWYVRANSILHDEQGEYVVVEGKRVPVIVPETKHNPNILGHYIVSIPRCPYCNSASHRYATRLNERVEGIVTTKCRDQSLRGEVFLRRISVTHASVF